ENGFYYDVDPGGHQISSDDFERIEQKMLELAREKNQYIRKPISREDALSFFSEKGDEYKIELIEKRDADEALTLYQQGNFIDLFKGPHQPHTVKIKAVKMMNMVGSYRQGEENRQQ